MAHSLNQRKQKMIYTKRFREVTHNTAIRVRIVQKREEKKRSTTPQSVKKKSGSILDAMYIENSKVQKQLSLSLSRIVGTML